MNTSDYDFDLDESLIAQTPLDNRSSSKLMILDKDTGKIEHSTFENIINYLNKGDVLVLNDTKVIPARLYGVKEDTNALIEILLLKETDTNIYECLVKKAKKIKVGTIISFNNILHAECLEVKDEGIRILKFTYKGIFLEILEKLGEMPLPPYIYEKLEDKDRYQTVYAKNSGSAAAPTAGLHFTEDLLNKLNEKGIIITYITLHVGLGTFRPVNVTNIENHVMHSEFYQMSKETADILNNAKDNHKNIIAVGTTSTRTLETIMSIHDMFIETSGNTSIFIYPGFKFKAIDGLITNFHLPKSTLLMLISALSSKETIMNAYNEAILNKYRFFSFGDSMFIK